MTATIVCQNDPTHLLLSETVNTDSIHIIEPTCDSNGLYQYSAHFENDKFTDQIKIVDINARHDYELKEWHWNGVESATADFICKINNSHTATEVATITNEVVITPTCDIQGLIIYTASIELDDNIYTDNKIIGIFISFFFFEV